MLRVRIKAFFGGGGGGGRGEGGRERERSVHYYHIEDNGYTSLVVIERLRF